MTAAATGVSRDTLANRLEKLGELNMAVWLQIIGKRNSESLDLERQKIKDILSRIELDLSFLSNYYNLKNYKSDNWTLKKDNEIEYYEYPLSDRQKNDFNSIRIIFNNPYFIEFSGPFDFFSAWYWLGERYPEIVCKGWCKIFNQISKEYGVKELFYFSEWFFATELIYCGEENAYELFKAFEEKKANEKSSLIGLNYDEYFIEKI